MASRPLPPPSIRGAHAILGASRRARACGQPGPPRTPKGPPDGRQDDPQYLPAAALVIIGDGPLRVELQAEVDALGVAARVRLVGWRSDVRSVIGAADALLLPSLWEGFPLVAVEAMTASVPVVAASSPGLREWLVHDDNALLAPVTNHQQLAECLRRVFADRELRSRLIAGGRHAAECHTMTVMLDDHVQLYNELVPKIRK